MIEEKRRGWLINTPPWNRSIETQGVDVLIDYAHLDLCAVLRDQSFLLSRPAGVGEEGGGQDKFRESDAIKSEEKRSKTGGGKGARSVRSAAFSPPRDRLGPILVFVFPPWPGAVAFSFRTFSLASLPARLGRVLYTPPADPRDSGVWNIGGN